MEQFQVMGPLVSLPRGKIAVDSKIILVLKKGPSGEVLRYKARLVARGFSQRPGEDYGETFAPVTKHATVRLLLALAAALGLEAHVIDVNNAFLNAPLQEEVYLQQPHGIQDGTNRVFRLQKALYGLKQAPRMWNQMLGDKLVLKGFMCAADNALYTYRAPTGEYYIWVPVWVDDLLLLSNKPAGIAFAKETVAQVFTIKDLGPVQTYLGLQISRDRGQGGLKISLQAYVDGLEHRFATLLEATQGRCQVPMSQEVLTKLRKGSLTPEEAKPAKRGDFLAILGCLSYCANTARPDLLFAVSILGQGAADPRQVHLSAALKVLKHVINTKVLGLCYNKNNSYKPSVVIGCTDADWAGEPSGESRAAFSFMAVGAAVSWYSKRLHTIAASTAEAEYKALSQGAKEVIWFRRMTEVLGHPHCPSNVTARQQLQSATTLSTTPPHATSGCSITPQGRPKLKAKSLCTLFQVVSRWQTF